MYRTARPSGAPPSAGSSWPSASSARPPCPPRPASPTTAGEPKVIEVTTDTPLGTVTPHHPGAPVSPGPYSVKQPDGSRITLTAWGDSHQRLPDQRRLRRHEERLRRLAVRRSARGTARRVRPAGRQGRRRPPRAGCGRRSSSVRRSRPPPRPGPSTGARHGQRPAARPGHPGVLRRQGQRRQHRGPVVGLLRRRQQRLRLLPGQQLREVRARAGRRECRRGQQPHGVVGWLQLPYDHPNFGNDFDASETKLGVDAVTAADPYVDYASFDTQQERLAQRLRAHVTVIVAGYGTSYGGEATSAATACGVTREACTTQRPSSTAPS